MKSVDGGWLMIDGKNADFLPRLIGVVKGVLCGWLRVEGGAAVSHLFSPFLAEKKYILWYSRRVGEWKPVERRVEIRIHPESPASTRIHPQKNKNIFSGRGSKAHPDAAPKVGSALLRRPNLTKTSAARFFAGGRWHRFARHRQDLGKAAALPHLYGGGFKPRPAP